MPNLHRYFSDYKTVYFFLLLCFILSVVQALSFSFSNDELSAIARLQFGSFSRLIQDGVLPDYHPAGVQVFLYYYTKLFGYNEVIVRLPFILFGLGAALLIYKTALLWFNHNSALLTVAVFSVLAYPLLYNALARPYSPGLFFTMLTAYSFSQLIVKNNHKKFKYTLLFILGIAGSMYVHYYAMLTVGIFLFAGLFWLNKQNLKTYLLVAIAVAIIYLPHVSVFFKQLSKGGIGGEDGWLGKPEPHFLFDFIKYSFNESWIYAAVVLAFVIYTVVAFKERIASIKFRWLALLVFLLSFLAGYSYSLFVNPILQFSTLLFSFPFFLMFLFSFVPAETDNNRFYQIATVFIIFSLASTLISTRLFSKQNFAVFKEIAHEMEYYDNLYGGKNFTKVINVNNPYYINFYLGKNKPNYELTSIEKPSDFRILRDVCESSKTEFFISAWSNKYNAPETEQIIMDSYPFIAGEKIYFNSGIRIYSKSKNYEVKPLKVFFQEQNNFEKALWANDKEHLSHEKSYRGIYSCKLDSLSEYGSTFERTIARMQAKPGATVDVKLMAYLTDSASKAALVISLDGKNGQVFWRAWDMKPYYFDKVNQWQKVFLSAPLPDDLNNSDVLKVYVWNQRKELLYVDDVQITISNR